MTRSRQIGLADEGLWAGQQGAGSGNTASVMKDTIVPSGSPT